MYDFPEGPQKGIPYSFRLQITSGAALTFVRLSRSVAQPTFYRQTVAILVTNVFQQSCIKNKINKKINLLR